MGRAGEGKRGEGSRHGYKGTVDARDEHIVQSRMWGGRKEQQLKKTTKKTPTKPYFSDLERIIAG